MAQDRTTEFLKRPAIRSESGPEEIAARDYRGPARQGQTDPQNDLRIMRPGRMGATRRTLNEESAEPAVGGIVGATGHMRFQLACLFQYGLFVSFVQRNHAEIRNTTYMRYSFT